MHIVCFPLSINSVYVSHPDISDLPITLFYDTPLIAPFDRDDEAVPGGTSNEAAGRINEGDFPPPPQGEISNTNQQLENPCCHVLYLYVRLLLHADGVKPLSSITTQVNILCH